MKYFYGNNGFYPAVMKDDYIAAGSWPENGVECDEDVFSIYAGEPPEGKLRGTDSDGMPCWVDAPEPTQEELVTQAETMRNQLISAAKQEISIWQSELLLGSIDDADKASLIAWIAYIKSLKAVDANSAPDAWPSAPTS
ncbi:tail fiber assembly protein [Rahnella inusitata]|uniref:tail fiber assembly protein n=1 Tax=Rahnella inusitata TaxID=58169 RepID=UPI0039BEADEB